MSVSEIENRLLEMGFRWERWGDFDALILIRGAITLMFRRWGDVRTDWLFDIWGESPGQGFHDVRSVGIDVSLDQIKQLVGRALWDARERQPARSLYYADDVEALLALLERLK